MMMADHDEDDNDDNEIKEQREDKWTDGHFGNKALKCNAHRRSTSSYPKGVINCDNCIHPLRIIVSGCQILPGTSRSLIQIQTLYKKKNCLHEEKATSA